MEYRLQVADEIDALRPGHSVWIGEHEITRVDGSDTELYRVDGELLSFYEAVQATVKA